MSQNAIVIPTSGPLSGASLVAKTNAALDSLATNFIGASAPSLAKAGQFWIGNATTLWPVQIYDGTDWIALGSIDTATNSFIHSVANGTLTAPGLYFASDPTTGVYRPGAGVVGLIGAGALAASFGTSYGIITGNLSVGTGVNATLASAKGIHVGGGGSAELHLTTTGTGSTSADGLSLVMGSDGNVSLSLKESSGSFNLSAPGAVNVTAYGLTLGYPGGEAPTASDMYFINILKNQDAATDVVLANKSTAASENVHARYMAINGSNGVYFGITGSAYTATGLLTANVPYLFTSGAPGLNIGASSSVGVIRFFAGGSATTNEMMRLSPSSLSVYGGLVVGSAALATTATAGFLWIPSCAGTPTGAPTAPYTNAAAIVADTTANKLWVRLGSTWRSVALA